MTELAIIGSMAGANVAAVGAIIYLAKMKFSNGKNGHYATPSDVDDVHTRINQRVETCSSLRDSCHVTMDQRNTEILQRLTRIETLLNGKN